MKVNQLINKLQYSSNAMVVIKNVVTRDFITLQAKGISENIGSTTKDMRVNSFNVIDNVITIYAE